MKSEERPVVMLIDDNEIDNYINKKLIQNSGISDNILVMGTTKKALKYLKERNTEETPDIILLDINLPAVNGYEFLRKFEMLPKKLKSLFCQVQTKMKMYIKWETIV